MSNDLQQRVRAAAPNPSFTSESVRRRAARRHVRRRVTSGVVALAVAVLGIGGLFMSFANQSATNPAAGSDGTIHWHRLPITAAVGWSESEQHTLADAEYLLTSECMSRAGFDIRRDPWTTPFSNMERRYGGITDLDAATRWGYGLPPSEIVDDSASIGYFKSLSPERRHAHEVAMFGTEDEMIPVGTGGTWISAGCIGERRDVIYGSRTEAIKAEELRELTQGLTNEALTSSSADPRVEAAIAEWSSCMATEGIDVNHPYDAGALAPEGSAASRDIAVADVRCKDKTDLVEIWSSVEASIQARLLDENRQSVDELVALRQQAIDNAERILAG